MGWWDLYVQDYEKKYLTRLIGVQERVEEVG